MFLDILSSLDLFWIISHVSTIYYIHCHECFCMSYNINTIFDTKTCEKSSINYNLFGSY
jgi:hypothetical protein